MSRRSCVRHDQKTGKNIPNRRGYSTHIRQVMRQRKARRWAWISSAITVQIFGLSPFKAIEK